MDIVDDPVMLASDTELVAVAVELDIDELEESSGESSDSVDAEGSVDEGETVHIGTITPVAGS